MRKPTVFIGLVIGAGVAVCAPDIRAYRRLAGISRTLREDLVTSGSNQTAFHADRAGS